MIPHLGHDEEVAKVVDTVALRVQGRKAAAQVWVRHVQQHTRLKRGAPQLGGARLHMGRGGRGRRGHLGMMCVAVSTSVQHNTALCISTFVLRSKVIAR